MSTCLKLASKSEFYESFCQSFFLLHQHSQSFMLKRNHLQETVPQSFYKLREIVQTKTVLFKVAKFFSKQ